MLKAPNGVPDRFRVVAQSKISAKMRDKIKPHVTSLGVKDATPGPGPNLKSFCGTGPSYCSNDSSMAKPFRMPRKT